jgi:O-antigen/teichoic acid export membrane protein
MVAGLAKAHDDQATRTELATKFFRLASVGLFPCAAGLTVVAPDVMLVLGGRQWSESGTLLFYLAPSIVAQGLNNLGAYLLSASGRAGRLLAAMLLLLGLLAVGMLAGLSYGRVLAGHSPADNALAPVVGMALVQTSMITFVWLVPYFWYCLRTARVEPLDVLCALVPALRASLLMGIAGWLLRGWLEQLPSVSPALRLIVVVAVGAVTFSLLAQRELRWAWQELISLRAASHSEA